MFGIDIDWHLINGESGFQTIPAFGLWAILNLLFMGVLLWKYPLCPPWVASIASFAFMLLSGTIFDINTMIAVIAAILMAGVSYTVYGMRR